MERFEIEAELWDYIDGRLLEPRRSEVERLVAEQAEWKATYESLLATNTLMSEIELEEPSMRFTRNVMDAIARESIAPATRTYINQRVVRGIFAFFGLLIFSLLAYAFASIDWSGSASTAQGGVDLGRIDYSKVFNNNLLNGFFMLNIILGLYLLDRALAARRAQSAG